MTGDNLLAEFASVVVAVRCAAEVQDDVKGRNAEVCPEPWVDYGAEESSGDDDRPLCQSHEDRL